MGLFDIFKGSSSSPKGDDKELARLQKMVSNKLSQNIDREDALARLGQMATPAAAKVLLSRFSWTLNPSIKDQEEKEVAVRGIVAAGDGAVEVIRNYCIRAETLSWPLKALRQIVGEERYPAELLSLVDEFDTDYMRDPAPKVQLMQAIGEFPSDEVRVSVQPFLLDQSEEVRFSAVAAVLGCKSGEAAESLASALAEEESLRVKNRILAGMVEQGMSVPADLVEKVRSVLPRGFTVSESGTVSGSPAR